MLLLGTPVVKVTNYVIIITASCSAIIDVSYGTMTLLLRDTVCSDNLSEECLFEVLKLVRATLSTEYNEVNTKYNDLSTEYKDISTEYHDQKYCKTVMTFHSHT